MKSGGFGAYSATDQEEILASSSGLLNFLFGKDRKGKLNRSAFLSFYFIHLLSPCQVSSLVLLFVDFQLS